MSKFDPATLDRMYNNRALVPEHPRHLQSWAEWSATARNAQSCRIDVRYGSGACETLDVFPTHHAAAPVLVFIHGGWFRALDKADHSFIAPAFTRKGACVVVPNYALAPAVTVDQIVMQMVEALVWTYRNIALYGGDPRRIVVAGHSAGGHLAAMMLCCDWRVYARDLPAGLVKAALAVSGLFEMDSVRHTPFLQCDLQLTPASVRQLSPAWIPAPKKGELYALVGGDESAMFLQQNALIQQAWGSKAVPVCEALPGLNHFSVLEALAQPQHRLHQLACELLGLK
jgi:arylformamidase